MAHTKLTTIVAALLRNVNRMEILAVAAQQWPYVKFPKSVRKFKIDYMELVIEMAFLQAFSAWEAFLEESFILYLAGKKTPRGKNIKRYAIPPSRKVAEQLIVTEGREYADWTDAQNIIKRAERFFSNGEPYSNALKSHQAGFQDMKTIRNAIAHSSSYSWERCQLLIRRELGTYPPNLNIGGFLAMTVPNSSPPVSFLERYMEIIRMVADRIVPS